jgi:ribose transport system substrate-binding protein
MRRSSTRTGRLPSGLLALLAVFALVAAACGEGAEDEAGDDAETTESTADSGDDAAGESGEDGDAVLSDAYSEQIARNKDVQVDTSEFAAEPPYTIATVVQGPINGWGTIFDAVMNDAFESHGDEVEDLIYVPWEGVTENQVRGIDDAIAADVDAILLTSLSRAGLAAAVDRAEAAGIPVVVCMAGVETDSYTVEVSRDIPRMGYDSAKAVAEQLGGEGNVVMLHGIAGVDAAEFWKSGATEAFAEYPGIEIVDEQYGNWSAADAVGVMRTVIAQQSDIDAVWVGGLEMGPAVIDAFDEAGRDVPFIGGTNPTNGFLRLAQENELEFFVAPFPPAASQACVETVFQVLAGETIPKYQDVIDIMDGVAPYGTDQLDAAYEPDFNDDFIGPKVADDDVYLEAGFGR